MSALRSALALSRDLPWYSLAEEAPKLGSGVSRDVYALSPTHVLKVARSFSVYGSDWGQGANRDEVSRWYDYGSSGLLAPIYDHSEDFVWIVQARCETFRSHPEMIQAHSYKEYDSLCAVLEGFGIEDLHAANLGTFDGRLVAIDYAT